MTNIYYSIYCFTQSQSRGVQDECFFSFLNKKGKVVNSAANSGTAHADALLPNLLSHISLFHTHTLHHPPFTTLLQVMEETGDTG